MAPLLQMSGIVKRFPGVVALSGVDLDVRPGEVHCLLGQNGAGKSTLIKILSGAYQPDEGELFWNGQQVSVANPIAALKIGVATIYQELDLVDGLSVADNVFLGHERSAAGFVRRSTPSARRADCSPGSGTPTIHPGRAVGSLSAAAKQIVSMARALSYDSRRHRDGRAVSRAGPGRGRQAVHGHPRSDRRRRGHRLHLAPPRGDSPDR